jgi:hypothetical protein
MSQPDAAPPPITARHYQALCGLALAAFGLIQYQQSLRASVNGSLMPFILPLVVFIGAVGVAFPVRLNPMLVLLAFAVPRVIEQFNAGQNLNAGLRNPRMLDVGDMMTCMAGLVFFIGYYRLQGLWFGVLPPDARPSAKKDGPPKARSESSLSPPELLALIFTVPGFALAAQLAYLVLRQRWQLLELPPAWRQFLFVAWTLLLTMFLAAQAFRYWRRVRMDRATARVMLQDILWNETRGEQRALHRWLAWAKLRERNKK